MKDRFLSQFNEYTFKNLIDQYFYIQNYVIGSYTKADIVFDYILNVIGMDGRNTICCRLDDMFNNNIKKPVTAVVDGVFMKAYVVGDFAYIPNCPTDPTSIYIYIPRNVSNCYSNTGYPFGEFRLAGNFIEVPMDENLYVDYDNILGDMVILPPPYNLAINYQARRNIHIMDMSTLRTMYPDVTSVRLSALPVSDDSPSYIKSVSELFIPTAIPIKTQHPEVINIVENGEDLVDSEVSTTLLLRDPAFYIYNKYGFRNNYIESFKLKDVLIINHSDDIGDTFGGHLYFDTPKIVLYIDNPNLYDVEVYFKGELLQCSYTVFKEIPRTYIYIGIEKLYNTPLDSLEDMLTMFNSFKNDEHVLTVVKKPKSYYRIDLPMIDDYKNTLYLPRDVVNTYGIKVYHNGIKLNVGDYFLIDNGEFTVMSFNIVSMQNGVISVTGYKENLNETRSVVNSNLITLSPTQTYVYCNGKLLEDINDMIYLSERRSYININMNAGDNIESYRLYDPYRGAVGTFLDQYDIAQVDTVSAGRVKNTYDPPVYVKNTNDLVNRIFAFVTAYYETGVVENFETMSTAMYDRIVNQFPNFIDPVGGVLIDVETIGQPRDVVIPAMDKYIDSLIYSIYTKLNKGLALTDEELDLYETDLVMDSNKILIHSMKKIDI